MLLGVTFPSEKSPCCDQSVDAGHCGHHCCHCAHAHLRWRVLLLSLWQIMKALDYSLPWGRKGEDVLTQDWDDFQQDIHKSRLKNMKPEVRKFMAAPKEGLSMKTRAAKRQALKRARYLDIELENRVLLNKLSHLMRHPAEIYESMAKDKLGPNSLNKAVREKEFKRVNRENQKLVSRIEKNKGEYSRKTWAKEREKHEGYLKSMSRYDRSGKRKCLQFSKRHKHKSPKRRTWARTLPPVVSPITHSQSTPSFTMTSSTSHQHTMDVSLRTVVGKDQAVHVSTATSPASGNFINRRGEDRIPDNTKIYEIGKNLSGVFTILSASTRGKMLVIEAYVPSDQVTVEKTLSVHDVQRIMSDQIELLQKYKREELCRALIDRVTFFFRDGKRVLLIEEGRKKVKERKEVSPVKTEKAAKEKAGTAASLSNIKDSKQKKESKRQNVAPTSIRTDGKEKTGHLGTFRCGIKMPASTHQGLRLLCCVFDAWQVQLHKIDTMQKYQCRLPPQLSEQLKVPSLSHENRVMIIREYLIEENIIEKPESSFDPHAHRRNRRK